MILKGTKFQLKVWKYLMTLDGEIPTSYFLIISIALTILSYLVYKKNGKSLEVYFLSVLTIIFYLSYFILIFVGPR